MAGTYDYVVIGSGAGGGPLAANLALEGFRVLLLEAGGETDGTNYQTPAFHALATEDPKIRWDYYVRHFEDEAKQAKNFNYDRDRKGIWYPRAATLGGCTAHNAMITIAPPDCDWDYIADVTGDESWRAERMRRYFTHLEKCRYRGSGLLSKATFGRRRLGSSGHGFSGWLSTEAADPRPGIADPELLRLIYAAIRTAGANTWLRLLYEFDPNDRALWGKSPSGISAVPLATDRGCRTGPREYLRRISQLCPHLTIKTRALVTRILLDDERRAVGVEYVEGSGLYWASPQADHAQSLAAPNIARINREVILCAGAFNSPQLLMLSGIGSADELTTHQIETRVDLPGVGKNLQDHYEISVVSKMKRDFSVLREAHFSDNDPAYNKWLSGKGVYTSNGVILGILYQSSVANPKDGPDLYIFGLPTDFRGYAHGYSKRLTADRNRFTWIILKARTGTSAGTVSLASADPRCPPRVDFAYFPQRDPGADRDLTAMAEGVRFVERINARLAKRIEARIWPPLEVQSPEDLKQFIQNNAWGHHASCSNRMGPAGDPAAVVDSRFRVHGTKALRVVDASVFPRIPGHFISAAIYMMSEKAVDDILEDAGRNRRV